MASNDTTNLEAAAIRCGCTEADAHLMCSYPDCTCAAIPKAIKAAIRFLSRAEGQTHAE